MAAEQDLFFDWNAAHAVPDRLGEALVLDETLRDGIQSPSAVDPRIEEKIEIPVSYTHLTLPTIYSV